MALVLLNNSGNCQIEPIYQQNHPHPCRKSVEIVSETEKTQQKLPLKQENLLEFILQLVKIH